MWPPQHNTYNHLHVAQMCCFIPGEHLNNRTKINPQIHSLIDCITESDAASLFPFICSQFESRRKKSWILHVQLIYCIFPLQRAVSDLR